MISRTNYCAECEQYAREIARLTAERDDLRDLAERRKWGAKEMDRLREFRRRVQTALEHCTTYDQIEAALFELLEREE